MGETSTPRIHRGLKEVYFDRSRICDIDGRAGRLWYRGYSIDELAQRSTFEEVAYLLAHGELPTGAELETLKATLREARVLPDAVLEVIRGLAGDHPMAVLRTAVSALSAFDPEAADGSPEAVARKGVRLTAQVPAIVAAHERIRNGLEPVAADPELGHAANLLYQLKGERPSPDAARLLDTDLILHAEHGSNASSFTARVVTSTRADTHAAMTAAVAALSGPAHGGAAEDVMRMAEEIGDPANAAEYVRRKRAAREPVMGFGHRVYRAEDPRACHMREGVKRVSEEMGQPHWYQILEAVVEAMRPYARHGVNVNVDFYSGVVYHLHGLPRDLFVPLFAIGRVPGWTAQILEQMEQNILIRPLTLYDGPEPRPYVPIEERG
ncbi:citrate/2-methylcitrate synthase [Arhodomonas sp. SL1]|uniref:citrate/2-methylcitrate synthase n=1 Tax=Arhodomonas sp. SL1 TaxID=3425691 RepID=UPI003F8815BF